MTTEQAAEATEELVAKAEELVATAEQLTDSERMVEELTDEILAKILSEIAPISESKPWRKLEIFGPPGTGKTAFACGVKCDPDYAKGVLCLDIEGGAETLHNHPECAETKVVPYKSLRQIEVYIDKLAQKPPELDFIHTLVIDTFSSLQERDLRNIVDVACRMDSSHGPVAEGKDYQTNTEHMKTFVSKLRDLDRNVILITHSQEVKDESSGRILYSPNITPKLSQYMVGALGLIGYYTRTEGDNGTQRNLQVHPTLSVNAKTRIGGLPPVMVDPKITDLITKWKA